MYYGYYMPREDGDWDLVAVVADTNEIDEDISEAVKLGIDRAFGSLYKIFGEPFITEQDDPNFPQVWSVK